MMEFNTNRLCGMLTLCLSLIALSLPGKVVGGSEAGAPNAADARALQALLSGLHSLSGEFNQTLTDPAGDVLQESTGDFSIKRPGKFHWRTHAPYEQLLVSDQETLWLFDPDLEQVTVRPFDSRLQQTPVLLLSGDVRQLVQTFEIRLDKLQGAKRTFILIPRSEDQLFASLSLTFDDKQLSDMSIRDSLGQVTHFSLSDVQVNGALDDSLFHFQAPPGTDVLIDEQP